MYLSGCVVDPNTLNLDPDQGFYFVNFEKYVKKSFLKN